MLEFPIDDTVAGACSRVLPGAQAALQCCIVVCYPPLRCYLPACMVPALPQLSATTQLSPTAGGREDTLVEMSFYVPRDNADFRWAWAGGRNANSMYSLLLLLLLLLLLGAPAVADTNYLASCNALAVLSWLGHHCAPPPLCLTPPLLPCCLSSRGEAPEAAEGEEGEAPAGPVDPPSKVLFDLVSQFTDAGAATGDAVATFDQVRGWGAPRLLAWCGRCLSAVRPDPEHAAACTPHPCPRLACWCHAAASTSRCT